MFSAAFLQHTGNGPLRLEEQLLQTELQRLGVPITLYTIKQIRLRSLPLTRDSFVAGDMDAMHGALAQLGITPPLPNDYPPCLAPFLRRRVWRSTLGMVERSIVFDLGQPVFAKPAARRKSFTGRAFVDTTDFYRVGSVSRRQEVWCSEIVEWVSEYRVYVVRGEIVAEDHYAGDAAALLDRGVVEDAIRIYGESGEAPLAYGIDFGVLATGQTALVEANDGYALGAYAINAGPYFALVAQRWQELLATAQ